MNTGRTWIKKGQRLSPKTEFKKGLIPWNKGRTGLYTHAVSDEARKKISEARKKQTPPTLGKHHSEETRKKMSESAKRVGTGKWLIGFKKPPITEETREKLRKSHLGQVAWNKGMGNYSNQERERHKKEAGLWRVSVYLRDDYTCQKCGKRGGRLHAHHIFNFATHIDLRFAIDNGITLCKDCHNKFHKKYRKNNNTKEQLIEFLNL